MHNSQPEPQKYGKLAVTIYLYLHSIPSKLVTNMTNDTETESKELRILKMVKKTLTDVARDTYTPPELKHPLSEQTIKNIRECLNLITAREAELATQEGQVTSSKPHFIDEPSDSVVVKFDTNSKKGKK